MLLFCGEVSYSLVKTAFLTQKNDKLNFRSWFWTTARIAGIWDPKALAMATTVERQGFLDSAVYTMEGGKGKRTQGMYQRPSRSERTAEGRGD